MGLRSQSIPRPRSRGTNSHGKGTGVRSAAIEPSGSLACGRIGLLGPLQASRPLVVSTIDHPILRHARRLACRQREITWTIDGTRIFRRQDGISFSRSHLQTAICEISELTRVLVSVSWTIPCVSRTELFARVQASLEHSRTGFGSPIADVIRLPGQVFSYVQRHV